MTNQEIDELHRLQAKGASATVPEMHRQLELLDRARVLVSATRRDAALLAAEGYPLRALRLRAKSHAVRMDCDREEARVRAMLAKKPRASGGRPQARASGGTLIAMAPGALRDRIADEFLK